MDFIDLQSKTYVSSEDECYTILKEYFTRKGYLYRRIEGAKSFPDIWVGKDGDYAFIEVKLYKKGKDLKEITLNDLRWEVGQLDFRRMIHLFCGEKYCLVFVFNPTGKFRVL